MKRRSNFSKEVIVQTCEDYLSGSKGISQISHDLSVHFTTVYQWVKRYQKFGKSYFDDKFENKSYSKEFKLIVIQDYLGGNGSISDLALKYDISDKSMVSRWLKVYNGGNETKSYKPKEEVYTMKARITTFEERLEIVKFVLDHDKEYKLAASNFNVPYSLVYQWTRKYLESGEDSLKYQNKGPKPKDYIPVDLSETEKLRRENEVLKRQLEYAKLQNEVLKKKNN